jgi:hypothetical protein
MEQSMTPDFLAGIFLALIPSMLTVAWLVWRATPLDEYGSLDEQLDQSDESVAQDTYPDDGAAQADADYGSRPNSIKPIGFRS